MGQARDFVSEAETEANLARQALKDGTVEVAQVHATLAAAYGAMGHAIAADDLQVEMSMQRR